MSCQGLVWLWLVLNTGAFLLEIFYMCFPACTCCIQLAIQDTVRMNMYIFSFLLLSHQSVRHCQTLPGGDQQ